jgi:hypothetical protein
MKSIDEMNTTCRSMTATNATRGSTVGRNDTSGRTMTAAREITWENIRTVSAVISSTPVTMRVCTLPDSYKDHVLIHSLIGTHVGDDEHGVDMTIKTYRPTPQIVYFVSCQT